MKLSIITICYNIKNEIERTCESIVNQTFQDFEWIVIDGGSTDGTLDVLEKYKDRINILISEKDNGIYDAMNKGILKAGGDYINFMNGGDSFYDLQVLENVVPLLGGADVYYGNVNLVHSENHHQVLFFPEYLPNDYFMHSCINHQSSFIKKDLFEKFGLYNTMIQIVTEAEKWIVYQRNNCSFRHLRFVIANYALGGQSEAIANNTRLHLQHYFSSEEKLAYKNLHDSEHEANMRVETASLSYPTLNITRYRLFNFIPIMKKIESDKHVTYYLFNQIPVWETRV